MDVIGGKVAAVVTRNVTGITEVCVFEHDGLVQLPAGTLWAGEDPVDGARREAWEETGLPHLEVVRDLATIGEFDLDADGRWALMVASYEGCPIVPGASVLVLDRRGSSATITSEFYGWTGVVDSACVTRDVTRSVVHLRTTAPTPEEWWVITPDGHGSHWRCHWAPVDDPRLTPWQQRWLDEGRRRLEAGRPIGRLAPTEPTATELFYAPPFGGHRRLCTPHRRRPGDGEAVGSCTAAAITADGQAVIGTSDPTLGWGFPGGRHEAGETIEETIIREIDEEVCARVLDLELLFTNEFVHLDDDRNEAGRHMSPNFWARVELDDWVPRFETTARRLIPFGEVQSELRWQVPPYIEHLDRAAEAEERNRGREV